MRREFADSVTSSSCQLTARTCRTRHTERHFAVADEMMLVHTRARARVGDRANEHV